MRHWCKLAEGDLDAKLDVEGRDVDKPPAKDRALPDLDRDAGLRRDMNLVVIGQILVAIGKALTLPHVGAQHPDDPGVLERKTQGDAEADVQRAPATQSAPSTPTTPSSTLPCPWKAKSPRVSMITLPCILRFPPSPPGAAWISRPKEMVVWPGKMSTVPSSPVKKRPLLPSGTPTGDLNSMCTWRKVDWQSLKLEPTRASAPPLLPMLGRLT